MAVRSGWRPLFIKLSSGKFNILSGKCQEISKLVFCGNHALCSDVLAMEQIQKPMPLMVFENYDSSYRCIQINSPHDTMLPKNALTSRRHHI